MPWERLGPTERAARDAALHSYLDEGGFPEAQQTERQRMANPRMVCPIDPGLIPLYERSGREHRGRGLETVVLLELERRGYTADWVRAAEGWGVDFFAERPGDPPLLVQVSLDTAADAT